MKFYRKCYSTNNEDYRFDTLEDAQDDLINGLEDEFLKPGTELSVYEADAVDFEPSDFVTDHRVSNFLEDMSCAAQDEAGEHAEDFDYCTPEAREELKFFLKDWANRSLTAAFYGVRNEKEISFTLTQEMIDEVCGNVL
ncbi:MAG: hypothetical protein [Caudoviricetes sp.]|nr:MAG: hypothetical protein [Caudoviricetes sp.]